MKLRQMRQLAMLNELRAAGGITDDEFDEQKRKLISARTNAWPFILGLGLAMLIVAGLAANWAIQNEPDDEGATPKQVESEKASSRLKSVEVTEQKPDLLIQSFMLATGHEESFDEVRDGNRYRVVPVRIINLPSGFALLTTREIPDGCHACTGYLGVYYFNNDDGDLQLTRSFPEAIPGWGWGAAPPEWTVTNKFTKNPAIYAAGGFMGQGILVSGATITELSPSGPIASDLIGTGYSDEGANDPDSGLSCNIEGKIANIVKDKGFDVIVSGDQSEKDHYFKQNGRFVTSSNREWDMGC